MTLEHLIYALFFLLGLSLSELLHAIFDRGYLKRIAIAQERFAEAFEKEVKR